MLHQHILKMLPFEYFLDCGLMMQINFFEPYIYDADRLVPFASPRKNFVSI